MMLARSPIKRPSTSPAKTGTTPPVDKGSPVVEVNPTRPVRKSVDDLEHRKATSHQREMPATHKPNEGLPERTALSVLAPPKRSATATQCCEAIREQLGLSGNIKREIKREIEVRVNQIERIIRAYEEDRKRTLKGQSAKMVEAGEKQANSENELLKKLEENERLIKENGKVIQEIKERIGRQEEREKERERREPSTYAGAVAGRPGAQLPERTTLHSVAVTSKDEKDTGEQVLERLRKVANEDEGWVKVEKLRKAKDRRIIIGYRTEEDRKRAQKRLEEREKSLTVEEIKNKDPLLILYNVLKNLKDEELTSAIRARNRDVFRGLKPEHDRMSRRKLATDELILEASRRKSAVALVQEPYVGTARRMKVYQGVRVFQNTGQGGGTVKAAIAVFDPNLDVMTLQIPTNWRK
ncbi:unnamed protein product [Arctia plantaginis]|uniref:Uncharacterized protein n=1 Tax=Arctia plantaginis TaxID=874455 RepID=A0A8S1BP28_ARCPL|nr:unnamed protein product [Arctia plantaginis]